MSAYLRGHQIPNGDLMSSTITSRWVASQESEDWSAGVDGLVGDPVADSGAGVDDVGLAEFVSESGDRDFDGVGEWVDVFVPCLFEELFCAERAGACLRRASSTARSFGVS